MVKRLLGYLPSNNMEDPPYSETGDDPNRTTPELREIIPIEPNKAYDIYDVIATVVDAGSFLEVHPLYATNIVTGFARLAGRTVGVVANQPRVKAGSLDIDASDKAARFVRFCDSFNVPLLTLVDVSAYLPGVVQEHGGIIRHGAKLLYAYSEATVPKVTIILRKAYGGAYIAMCSHHLGADVVYALPTAEIAVMGADGAANIIFRDEIAKAPDPQEARKQKIAEFKEKFANPYVAAARGFVDDVLDPAEVRPRLVEAFSMAKSKVEERPAKKHGNIPV
jgi:acetyl-CoA carboxylase carboxyltransferase component